MTLKVLTHPVTGQHFRMGRTRPTEEQKSRPKLKFSSYVKSSLLSSYPRQVDYRRKGRASLTRIYLNDQLGDCVIAGSAHMLGVFTGNANDGLPFIFANKTIEQLYSAIGGYVPGNPSTDRGCNEQTALDYWQNKGLCGHKIDASISVDATNVDETRAALWLFECLMSGIELPDAWVNPMPSASGFVFDVAGDSDPENGHCMVHANYDADKAIFGDETWGMSGSITDAALAKYASGGVGELHAALSPDVIERASGRAPSGFDFAQLQADLAAL